MLLLLFVRAKSGVVLDPDRACRASGQMGGDVGKPIKQITIVGGGTAGWMSALLLMSLLKTGKGKGPKIKLIESPNIPTVGVGEATVPGMPRTLKTAGISEQEFFKTCNASFKLGVLFNNWNVDKAGKPISFVNPFARPPSIDGIDAASYFAKYGAGGVDFSQIFSPTIDLARQFRGPRALNSGEYAQGTGFAYHLDAGLFAKMLRDVCIKRGVEHIMEDMERVELDERGYVAAVHLAKTGRHPVELVLDCTGFRGLIIGEALGEEFISYSDYLANDRAMAVQLPHPDPEKLEPMTRSTALGAGWTWRVPLYNRIGTGYVYSSAHRSDQQAMDEFKQSLGELGKDAEPRVIPMRIGRNRNAWVKNCVSIGLANGFIEPLESTAIHMIDTSIRWLVTYFPNSDFAEPPRARYNKLVTKAYEEVRDFICLHYVLGNRTDSPYWIDAREELAVPDSLAENIELWKHAMPGPYDLDFVSLFSPWTYQAVLMGKRVYETDYASDNFESGIRFNPDKWKAFVTQARRQITQTVKTSADHRTLLRKLRGDGELAPAAQPWALMGGFSPGAGQATVQMPGQRAPAAARVDAPKAPPKPDESDDFNLL